MFQTINYQGHYIHIKTVKGVTIVSYCIMKGNTPQLEHIAKSIHAAKLAITRHLTR